MLNSADCDILPILKVIFPDGHGLIAALSAFMDRGARPDAGGVMCVAACLFQPGKYEKFILEWEQMLNEISSPPPPYFHAKEFFPKGGIFKTLTPAIHKSIGMKLPKILNDNLDCVVTVSFKENEFLNKAPAEWRKRFGSIYGVAVQMCAGHIGIYFNNSGYKGPISYFLEAGDQDQPHANRVLNNMFGIPKIKSFTRLHSFSFIKKGDARGLEAADYFAWHWNKFYAETMSRNGEARRNMRKDFRATVFGENPISDNQAKRYPVFIYTGLELDEFFKKTWATPRLEEAMGL